jgi:GT2 family glycosyltransferase
LPPGPPRWSPSGLLARWRRRQRPNVRIDTGYPAWLRAERSGPQAKGGPLISVLMPVRDTPADLLSAALASVRRQTYPNWELCVVDDASAALQVALVLGRQADPRIRIRRLAVNSGIAAATNAALDDARGAFVALLDHDDELAPHALARVAAEIASHPEAELIFSDEDKLVGGDRAQPYFKPGWNPDLMLGQNLVSHLGVYSRARLIALGGLRAGFEGSQDHDLALRVAEACGEAGIRHIPDMLYHWRQQPDSFSASHAGQAGQAGRRAVADRLPPGAEVLPAPGLPHWHRIVHPLPTPSPPVCLVVAGGGPAPPDTEYPAVGVATPGEAARGVVVLLAAGLRAPAPGWLRELASQARRPGIGAVGGRIDGADGRIRQSGLILDPARIGVTLRPGSDADDPGYVGHFRLARTVSAVSADCLAVRGDLFAELGGLDAACGPYADIDLCLRLAQRGLRCVWTPHAVLRYTIPPKRPADPAAARLMRARWGASLARDPYLNPNLAVRAGKLVLLHAPPRTLPT